MRRVSGFLVLALAALLLVLAVPRAQAVAEDIEKVLVTNFPAIQKVAGTVSVEGTISHATLERVKEVLVPPVKPTETTRLVDGGLLVTGGFTSVVLGLNGQASGKIFRTGTVGAILIPDEESVTRAFDEEGLVQFPLEVGASVTAGASRAFASSQVRLTLGFPRYRVRLYNTTDKSATVNLFAYLTN